MGITPFPEGLSSWGVPVLPGVDRVRTGETFWVDGNDEYASDSPGSNGEADMPFATIDYAIGKCENGRGDTIYVKEGHTETLSTAAALVVDVSDITLRHLGEGANRAKIEFTSSASADMDINAKNFRWVDPVIHNSTSGLTAGIDINSANCTIENPQYYDNSGTVDCVDADKNADYLKVVNWEHFNIAGTSGPTKQSIFTIADASYIDIRGVRDEGTFAVGPIECTSAWTAATLIGNGTKGVALDEYDNHFSVACDLNSTTWGSASAASHEIATVTGLVKIGVQARVTKDIAASAGCLLYLGNENDTDSFIDDTSAAMLNSGEVWSTTTSAANQAVASLSSGLLEKYLWNDDVGYTLTSGCNTGGLTFDVYWSAKSKGAYVMKGAGGSL